MRARSAIAAIAAVVIVVPAARAQNLAIPATELGARVTAASSRIGKHIDWGTPVCGEPKYLAGTCVWTLGPQLSLTANALGAQSSATLAVTRWSHFDLGDATNRRVFGQTCRALVAALRPDWPAARVERFESALIGAARMDQGGKG